MMRHIRYILFGILCGVSTAFAQKLTLTPFGVRSSDNPSNPYVEYSYRSGVNQKGLIDYCIQQLSQPDFFSYRVDYTDDHTIKLSGYTKPNLKGMKFTMLIEFGSQSVKVSAELYDKNGIVINQEKFMSEKSLAAISHQVKLSKLKGEKSGATDVIYFPYKKDRIKAEKFVRKHQDEVERSFDKIIRSMMEMKVIM